MPPQQHRHRLNHSLAACPQIHRRVLGLQQQQPLDVPLQQLASLFGVSFTIVSQVAQLAPASCPPVARLPAIVLPYCRHHLLAPFGDF